jgi:hypothetical protein
LVLALSAIRCGSLLCKLGRIAMDLADVAHDAIEQPLAINFALTAQREALEPARSSDVWGCPVSVDGLGLGS